MSTPRYIDLGASLYVPATHADLDTIVARNPHSARSIIICTEDAVAERDVAVAMNNLRRALANAPAIEGHRRFLRPRSPFVLQQLLETQGVLSAIDGVVIPKFTQYMAQHWARALEHVPDLAIMPTMETAEVFTESGVQSILDTLDTMPNPVPAIRIGANDLLGLMGLKRMPGQTVYDTPLRSTIERLLTLCRIRHYEVSAPVCDLISEPETLSREVAIDIAWGLYAKSCIHPCQLPTIEEHYRQAFEKNRKLADALHMSDEAVFRLDGQMLEATCHGQWAERTRQMAPPQLNASKG